MKDVMVSRKQAEGDKTNPATSSKAAPIGGTKVRPTKLAGDGLLQAPTQSNGKTSNAHMAPAEQNTNITPTKTKAHAPSRKSNEHMTPEE